MYSVGFTQKITLLLWMLVSVSVSIHSVATVDQSDLSKETDSNETDSTTSNYNYSDYEYSYSDDNVQRNYRLRNLKVLNLTNCQLPINDQENIWDKLLNNLPVDLSELFLSGTNYNGASIRRFESWHNLRNLHMSSCTGLKSEDWIALISNISSNIEVLDLERSSYCGENASGLAHFYRLKKLLLGGCKFSLENWETLVQYVNQWRIGSMPDVVASFSGKQFEQNEWIRIINSFPEKCIVEIDLSWSNYRGERRKKFRNFKSLKKLILRGCRISQHNKIKLSEHLAEGCILVESGRGVCLLGCECDEGGHCEGYCCIVQ